MNLRIAGASGRVLVRWDTRSSVVLATERTDIDPEVARVELARRYVRWLGPGTPKTFARLAGVEPSDAHETWRALEPELEPIEVDGAREWIHALDVDALRDPPPVTGARLLPPGDPYLSSARDGLLPDRPKHDLLWPKPNAVPRLPNGKPFLPGAILLDGEIAGIWARVGARVTLLPWVARGRDEMARAAEAMSGPLGQPVRLDWA